MNAGSTKMNPAARPTIEFQVANLPRQTRSQKPVGPRRDKPDFAPLHRYINCLMAEASGHGGVNKQKETK